VYKELKELKPDVGGQDKYSPKATGKVVELCLHCSCQRRPFSWARNCPGTVRSSRSATPFICKNGRSSLFATPFSTFQKHHDGYRLPEQSNPTHQISWLLPLPLSSISLAVTWQCLFAGFAGK
jgi:hypothetical protein